MFTESFGSLGCLQPQLGWAGSGENALVTRQPLGVSTCDLAIACCCPKTEDAEEVAAVLLVVVVAAVELTVAAVVDAVLAEGKPPTSSLGRFLGRFPLLGSRTQMVASQTG